MNNIENFGRQIFTVFGVKKFKIFEGDSLRFLNLSRTPWIRPKFP